MAQINIPNEQRLVFSVPLLTQQHQEFDLWFYTGSKCNLECTHCYVSSGPNANQHPFLTLNTFKRHLKDAINQHFKKLEIYFTGGEPFVNPEMVLILEESLNYANTTVLTNGTRFNDKITKKLAEIDKNSPFKLIFRVSFDGPTAELNDQIRGTNSFNLAQNGLKRLADHDLTTIITAMRSWSRKESKQKEGEFIELMVDSGIPKDKQNLKIIPPLRMGREIQRSRPYLEKELFTDTCFIDYDYNNLQCSKCRMISENGVWVCPILINEEGAKMGDTLEESFKPFPMTYMACWTCRMDGMSCTN